MHEKDDTTHELDAARRRDPDALPPSNRVELMGTWLFAAVAACTRGNVLFAIKAGALSGMYNHFEIYVCDILNTLGHL